MRLTEQTAKALRELYFGGNWTSVNFRETLSDVNWQQANTKIYSLNTIATLVYHTRYYVGALINVLRGNALDAHDKYSFNHPPVLSSGDWESLLGETWSEIENLAGLIELMPESRLLEIFSDEKYGNYYRNIQGIIEHGHYHLGQMVLIKKIMPDIKNNVSK